MSSQEQHIGVMAAVPVNKKQVRAVGTEGWSKWSSLSDDLLRRIADSFLASNDLDHYMCFRAVCPSWRSATDDPKDNASDPVFHPHGWIILDEVFQSDDGDMRIMLNTDTGRFLHKKLPLLREYYVVATTPSGFFVLADRTPPHAARVFNPLTGCLTRFAAPVPPEAGVAEVGRDKGAFYLYFLGDSSRKIYMVVPEVKDFVSRDCEQGVHNIFRDAVLGGAYPQHISGPALVAAFAELCHILSSPDSLKFFSGDLPGDVGNNIRCRCYVVGLDAEVFLHIEREGRTPIVFKMNTGIGKIEPVETVGTFAIFIGCHRCLTVDADKFPGKCANGLHRLKFPGIEANCIYYIQHSGLAAHIWKYNLKDKKVERLSEAAEFVKQDKQFVLVATRPFTIIQVLCSYTMNRMDSQLALQQMV